MRHQLSRAATDGPNRPYIYTISLIAAVGGFILGYDMMLMSGAIIFIEDHWQLNAWWKGIAMVSALFGVIPALLFAGPLADRFGRRDVLMAATILFGVSAIGTALPKTFLMWNVFRIVGGVAGGLASMISPMYIAEVAPARMRGRLVLMYQLAIVISSLASSIICWYLALPGTESWRWMFASELAPILLLIVALPMIPRSPRWLLTKGRVDEARQVLARIESPAEADRHIEEVQQSVDVREQGRFAELFLPGVRRALLIAVALAAFQQFGGVSTLSFYLPSIMQDAGIEAKADSIAYAIGSSTWVLVLTIVAIVLVDRLGRRPLLLFGTAGMCLGQFFIGLVTLLQVDPRVVFLVFLACNAAYVVSLAPLGWLIMSEVFPNRIRAKGMAVAVLSLQLAGMIVNGVFPPMMEAFEERVGTTAPGFWVFSLICLGAFVFSLVFVPETKGKSLEEIEKLFSKPT